MEDNKKALENESPDSTSFIIPQISGYVKLHRNILYWEWYSDLPVRVLFLHCLLKVNHKAKKWMGRTIQSGQFATSLNHLSKETALSQQQCRTALLKLKSTGELTIRATSRYSIITVNNWDKWQGEQQTKQHSSNKQSTTTKECKEYKEYNYIKNNSGTKIFKKPTVEEIKNYCLERKNSINPAQFYDYYESKGWLIGKTPMKDWHAAIRTWEQNNKISTQNRQQEYKEVWKL